MFDVYSHLQLKRRVMQRKGFHYGSMLERNLQKLVKIEYETFEVNEHW